MIILKFFKKDSNFDKTLNPNEFKDFNRLYSNIYRNKIHSSNVLNLFFKLIEIAINIPQLVLFFVIYILKNVYWRSFFYIFNFFIKSALYNSVVLLILLNKILIENPIFESNNDTKKIYKLTEDNKNKNDNNINFINQRKERKKLLIGKIYHLRNFIEIAKYIIILNLFTNIFVNNKFCFNEYNSYNITLKIKGIGKRQILTEYDYIFERDYYPDKVYINGIEQGNVNHSYNLNETNNFIGLKWDKLIISCNGMFYGCSDITEIDLSNFNTSNVYNMQSMFRDCSSLTSLNLSYFDTSKVTMMNAMFFRCSSLTSLNLSSFDTSKVKFINDMFNGCSNLEYINMINFNGKRRNNA